MLKFLSKLKYIFFTLLIVSSVIIYLFMDAVEPKKILPVYQPSMVNTELVDSTMQHIKKYHTIADFSLINQNG
ncbi:MAG: SCO family protein, partial [Arenibacter sp.]|nr:SCO family protein [Arenibacter sp.]